MDFYELYNKLILTEQGVLQLVDEYTLYCYYTQIEDLIPGKAYNAPPYRIDIVPSFSIYPSKKEGLEYMWKDHATGESGSIFKLIQKIEQLDTTQEVLTKINEDFALGYDTDTPIEREKLVLFKPPKHSDIKISIVEQPLTEQGLKFWQQLEVSKELLKFYNTEQVKYYWAYVGQSSPDTAPDPMFSYRIGNYHQLYSPYVERKNKFRNDYPENYFFGYLQLPKTGKTLILDKSAKDVIFCGTMELPAVCGKAETTFIPHSKMLELKDRFEKLYLMLDPDKAGKTMAEKYLQRYPWLIERYLPEGKDKSGLALKVGVKRAKEVILSIINE